MADNGRDTVTAGLQKMFASVVNEPIPDDFMRLLDAIDESAARLDKAPRSSEV